MKRSPVLRYGVAVLAVALALGSKLLIDPLIIQETPFLLVFAAIMVSAWYGGLGPGLLATVLAALITDYFFLFPRGSFSALSLEATPLIVFVLEGSLVSLLAAALHSARQRAEDDRERLRRSEERFRLLVEGVEDYAIFMLDSNGRVVSWNAGAERINGYGVEEILGEHFSRFYTQEDVERGHPEEELRKAVAEGRYEEEGLRVHKDGSRFWATVSITALWDETGNLRGFSKVVRDITERKLTEQRLQDTLDRLLALNEAGQTLGSTLESEEVISRLLEIMQRVLRLTAAVISVQEEDGSERIWRSVGPEWLWPRARYAPEAVDARRAALETQEHQLFLLQRPGSTTKHLVGLCLPLLAREHSLGVLEAYGPASLAESDKVDLLGSLASQAASALENAQLYGELANREYRLQDLVGKMLVAQEEERRRVAYEVHDGFTQTAISAYQLLQNFADDYPPPSAEATEELEEAIDRLERTIKEARRVIADLRPTALDDLGLAAAVRQQVEGLRDEGVEVGYEEALGEERLPVALETTLFRIAQEALANVRKHAEAAWAHVALEQLEGSVRLRVQDWGRGFEPAAVTDGGSPGERVGLSSMRERATLLGGALKVTSEPGSGTLVEAEIPLPIGEEETGHGG